MKAAFIESIFLGYDISPIIVARGDNTPAKLRGCLIDGQQRMSAIHGFANNEFPIFGDIWYDDIKSGNTQFPEGMYTYAKNGEDCQLTPTYFITNASLRFRWVDSSEAKLVEIYNRLNFTGIRHTEDQRAEVEPTNIMLYMHSDKAIRKGCPPNRLFVVVDQEKEGRKTYYVAWKCEVTKDGITHPAYGAYQDVLSFDDEKLLEKLAIKEGSNGSKPTAYFAVDSFYKKVTLEMARAYK